MRYRPHIRPQTRYRVRTHPPAAATQCERTMRFTYYRYYYCFFFFFVELESESSYERRVCHRIARIRVPPRETCLKYYYRRPPRVVCMHATGSSRARLPPPRRANAPVVNVRASSAHANRWPHEIAAVHTAVSTEFLSRFSVSDYTYLHAYDDDDGQVLANRLVRENPVQRSVSAGFPTVLKSSRF